ASQYPLLALLGAAGIVHGTVPVVLGAVEIVAPFPHVPSHIIEPPGIWLPLPNRVGLGLRIALEPPERFQFAGILPKIETALGASPAGVLPLRLGRQPVTVGREIALPCV